MSWKDSIFPKADDPKDVGWLISYWRIRPCNSCNDDYTLESRQFDHLIKAATRDEALKRFKEYVADRQLVGETPGIKGWTLFLSKVDTTVIISDFTGKPVFEKEII